MTTLGELKRMLEGSDKADASFPDLPAIMGRGRRLRRRRRAGVAVVAAACSLAIAVPVGIRAGTEDGRGSEAPVAPTPDRDSQQPDPKQEPSLPKLGFDCLDPWWRCSEGVAPARPLGAVIDTGVRLDGIPILLFAERREHYYELDNLPPADVPKGAEQPDPGEYPVVPTVSLGFRDPATNQLMSYDWVGWDQPDPVPPELTLLMIVIDDDGPWVMAGAVTDPDAAAATALEPGGSPVEAVGLSGREVAPGMRVFWASGDDYSDPDLPGVEFRLLDTHGGTLESCVVGGHDIYRGGCPAYIG